MRSLLILLYITLFCSFFTYAQKIHPEGRFISDSVKTGEPVKFYLTAYHPSDAQVLFPDSSYNFFPFELIKKEFYPTTTIHKQSFDSAIYILRTFELKDIQTLSLPVYMVDDGDSVETYTKTDSIFLKKYFSKTPENINLLESTGYAVVNTKFNYPYLIACIIFIIIMSLIFYLFFGKIIKRRYRLYKIRTSYLNYIKTFEKFYKEFQETKNSFTIEQALGIWKTYLSRLENKPINTYTTTEIINLYNKEELKNSLKIIDRAIYGGLISDEAEKALITLKRFSNRRFQIRKREIKNASNR